MQREEVCTQNAASCLERRFAAKTLFTAAEWRFRRSNTVCGFRTMFHYLDSVCCPRTVLHRSKVACRLETSFYRSSVVYCLRTAFRHSNAICRPKNLFAVFVTVFHHLDSVCCPRTALYRSNAAFYPWISLWSSKYIFRSINQWQRLQSIVFGEFSVEKQTQTGQR